MRKVAASGGGTEYCDDDDVVVLEDAVAVNDPPWWFAASGARRTQGARVGDISTDPSFTGSNGHSPKSFSVLSQLLASGLAGRSEDDR